MRLPNDVAQIIEQGEAIVVPSRQRAEALRLACAAAALADGRTVWPTPDVQPFEIWLRNEIERQAAAGITLPRLLSPAEEWFLWRRSTAVHTSSMELLARGPLAEGLLRASHLADEYGIDIARLSGAPGDEVYLLRKIRCAVEEACAALEAGTSGQLAARLAVAGGEPPVTLAGFLQLSPFLQTIVASRRLHGRITRQRVPPDTHGNDVRSVFAADASEELERIAEWCREQLDAQPDARLLVLLPGAPESRERLLTLVRQSLDARSALYARLDQPEAATLAALEGGAPLARTPLAAHALQSLHWLTGTSEFPELSAWLCAPYWQIPHASRARIDLWLREHGSIEMSPRALLGALRRVPDSLRQSAHALASGIEAALQELDAGPASPREWSERFLAALAALGWPGGRTLNSDEEQTRARFTQLLDEFGQLAGAAGSMSRDTAVQWLIELAGRTAFRPASADALVTISSRLEDPIVCYDGIWVAGLHADAWPEPARPDPFLPLAAQVAAGIPAATPTGRAQEAKALMAAWRAATPWLVLSAPLRADDVELSPSPLLSGLAALPQRSSSGSLWLPARLRREGLTEFLEDTAGTPWDAAHPLPSGTHCIELQNACPFRAYGELRLGGGPLDAPEPGVGAKVRGGLLHRALEKLWGILGGSEGLRAQSEEGLDALIHRCVEEAATDAMGPSGRVLRINERSAPEQRECRRAQRLIHLACRLERERAPFTVSGTELKQTLALGAAQVRVRMDRLDRLASGGLAILDYKTGRPVKADWYSERPSPVQLLAYLATVGEETVAMATVNLAAKQTRFEGIAATPNLLPRVRPVAPAPAGSAEEPWAFWRRTWRACVHQLASDFLEGRAAVDPRPKACEYCPIVSICRISDRSASAVEQNIDE